MALNPSQLNPAVSSRGLNSLGIDRTTRKDVKETVKDDLVCFSHLRWDFVYQRPQHLLSRAAKDRRVFFVEEPVFDNGSMRLEINEREGGVNLVVPHLPHGLYSEVATNVVLREMIDRLIASHDISNFTAWYYTPMAVPFTEHLTPIVTIYDCMDELSAFKGAAPQLRQFELTLFQHADLVFTGGQSLYEAKRHQHHSVFAFPSSIDRSHFEQARSQTVEPSDQRDLPHPRLGFFGVIDERFDVELLDGMAQARPDWQFVMIGPIVKIDPRVLPRRQNIHYLGSKNYQDLPAYLAGWDIALLLFARNEATRFISPTKTPEYLAAGKPVVSTSIQDVVRPYGEERLVSIADTPGEFIQAVEAILGKRDSNALWLSHVDRFLAGMSWDETWSRMSSLIEGKVAAKRTPRLSVEITNAARETQSAIAAGAV
jgi:UDP-galactopyranose mutase